MEFQIVIDKEQVEKISAVATEKLVAEVLKEMKMPSALSKVIIAAQQKSLKKIIDKVHSPAYCITGTNTIVLRGNFGEFTIDRIDKILAHEELHILLYEMLEEETENPLERALYQLAPDRLGFEMINEALGLTQEDLNGFIKDFHLPGRPQRLFKKTLVNELNDAQEALVYIVEGFKLQLRCSPLGTIYRGLKKLVEKRK